jgi:gas vesicle protein
MMYRRKTNIASFAGGAVLGALMGVMAGILFAPRSGKETRQEIGDTFREIKEKVAKEVSEMKQLTKRKYNQMVSGVVGAYQQAKKITPDQADDIMQILSDSFEEIEDAYRKSMR